jgi:hypothetical protein
MSCGLLKKAPGKSSPQDSDRDIAAIDHLGHGGFTTYIVVRHASKWLITVMAANQAATRVRAYPKHQQYLSGTGYGTGGDNGHRES